MEPRFFSILGLSPTRERDRSGLNDAESHRDGESWTLGVVPDSLVAAFRGCPGHAKAAEVRRGGRAAASNPAHSAS